MNNHRISRQVCCLLISLTSFWSCNGQEQAKQKVADSKQKTFITGDPRLVKTQGSSPYAAVAQGLQDRSGNLWFCAPGEGIYRYDGTSFTNFTTKDGLNSNNVYCVLEDKAGTIWFGTDGGICRYDPLAHGMGSGIFNFISIVSNQSNLFPYGSPAADPTTSNEVLCMLQDKNGLFWLGTPSGLYSYNGRYFTHFLQGDGVVNNTGLQLNKVETILEDKAGNLWFGGRMSEGLFRFDGKTLTGFSPDGKNWLRPVFEDRKGDLWFAGRRNSVYRYDGKTFTDFGHNELKGWVLSMAEDKNGDLWFAAENGVTRYDGKNFTHLTTKDGLSSNSVFSVTLDRSGKLWVGTRDMGLLSYDGRTFADFSDKSSRDVRCIHENRAGDLWLCTNGDGVCRYHPSAVSGGRATYSYFSIKEGLSGKDVRCVAEDKAGHLWFGTDGGVSEFDGKRFTNFTVKEGLPANDVWSILTDKAGTVWAATLEGVCRYDPSKTPSGPKLFSSFAIPAAEERDFSRPVTSAKLIWDMKEDRAGNIWFATNGSGVYRYSPPAKGGGAGSLTNIAEKDGLCSNFVNSILEDKNGDLWFATQHGGVCRYQPSAKRGKDAKAFTTFSDQTALSSGEVWTMRQDKTGNIWCSSGASLCRYNGSSFTSFTGNSEHHNTLVRNYIQSIEVDRKGNLWVGCSGGLYRFDGKSFVNLTGDWARGKSLENAGK